MKIKEQKNILGISNFCKWCARRYLIIVSIVLTISYFSFGTYRNWPYKVESDGKYYYNFLISGLFDGDFDFTNDYRVKKLSWMKTDTDHYHFRDVINPETNKPLNVFTVGPALLWLPFFVLAFIAGQLISLLGVPIDMNPYGKFFQYTVMYSGVVYCTIGIVLLTKMLSRSFSDSISKIATWIVLVATPLYYYTVFEASMSHVYDFFTFTLLLFLILNASRHKDIAYYIFLGFSGALHVLVRTQNIATVFVMLLMLFYHLYQNKFILWKLHLRNIGITGFALLFGLTPTMITNHYLFGHPFIVPQGDGFLSWFDPKILSLLFSPRNGLFSHHPVLLLGLIGYVALLIKSYGTKQEFVFFVLMFVAVAGQVYINATVLDWWSGDSYGQRRMTFSMPLFAFGGAYLIDRVYTYLKGMEICTVWISAFIVIICTSAGIYLTLIHVFLWDYQLPHNIIKWMFYYAPVRIL